MMPPTVPNLGPLQGGSTNLAVLALLAGLGVALNALPLPLFFGIHLLLGSVPAMLALLLWRTWAATAIALLAALQTWGLWGHPWAILIFSAELVWLTLALRRGPADGSKGEIILWDLSFWLLLGTPLVLLFYAGVLQIDAANVLVVAVKQTLNGVLASTLAFLLFLLARTWRARGGDRQGVSLRGVIVALVISSVLLPTLAVTMLVGQQLQRATERGERQALAILAAAVASAPEQALDHSLLLAQSSQLAYRVRQGDRWRGNSNQALFRRLDQDYAPAGRGIVQQPGLQILIPRDRRPLLKTWVNGYWTVHERFSGQSVALDVQVVQPAAASIQGLQRQSSLMLTAATLVVIGGALLSAWVGRVCEREFQRVLAPLLSSSELMPSLHLSLVDELRSLARLINARIARVQQLTAELDQQTITDPLTGCLNRRALDRQLPGTIADCHRRQQPLAVLALDIDHFKAINDHHGHGVGDAMLLAVVNCLRSRLRRGDPLFRIGGEEFLVLLPGCPLAEGLERAEAIRAALEGLAVAVPDSGTLRLTISIGVTALASGGEDPSSLLGRADHALYNAKNRGRNRVEWLGP
jgi:diguanylate cyclase (GGDEF)-like protein